MRDDGHTRAAGPAGSMRGRRSAYLATGRGATDGRCLRIESQPLREWAQAWFPFAAHIIAVSIATAHTLEVIPARQRSAPVTRYACRRHRT